MVTGMRRMGTDRWGAMLVWIAFVLCRRSATRRMPCPLRREDPLRVETDLERRLDAHRVRSHNRASGAAPKRSSNGSRP